MYGNFFIFCLIVTLFQTTKPISCKDDAEKLLAVTVVYRHGDRTALETYPKDPYADIKYWPDGFGQLTNAGKLSHFELGKWSRNRYANFLSDLYSHDEFYVQSTDVDRTLMSAQANLAGLYPPKGRQIWTSSLNWQPIPIHTLPEREDAVLAMKKVCPKYEEIYAKTISDGIFKQTDEKFKQLYAFLTLNTGSNITSFLKVKHIYTTLKIEQIFNYTLPVWTKEVSWSDLEQLSALAFAAPTYSSDLARLKAGPFFNELLEHFRNVSEHESDAFHKFKMFSAHDTTLVNLMNSLDVYDFKCPDYASVLIFELRKAGGDFFVKIFYKDDRGLREKIVRSCNGGEVCTLQEFSGVLGKIAVDLNTWSKECLN